MNLEAIKSSLINLKYGEVATVAMIDRGAYASLENTEEAAKKEADEFASLANEVLLKEEDLTIVKRSDIDFSLSEDEIRTFIEQMTAEKHLIFVEALYLGTSEVKIFLNLILEKKLLAASKLILLDLPQVEYMTLRDNFKGQIEL